MSVNPVLELVEVVKEHPGHPPVRAIDGVDLLVETNELVGIVGPSGSGKSTLLNLLGALERPTSGAVRLMGQDTAQMTDQELSGLRSRRIGFVFQAFHLLSGMSALDNVATDLLYRGIPTKQRRAAATDALHRVGLGQRLGHRPNELSGGERQRVAIARAVVGEPNIILADEPTGNLDSRSGAAAMDLLHRLSGEGRTIVIITHDNSIAEQLPRCVRVRDGRIESDERSMPIRPEMSA